MRNRFFVSQEQKQSVKMAESRDQVLIDFQVKYYPFFLSKYEKMQTH